MSEPSFTVASYGPAYQLLPSGEWLQTRPAMSAAEAAAKWLQLDPSTRTELGRMLDRLQGIREERGKVTPPWRPIREVVQDLRDQERIAETCRRVARGEHVVFVSPPKFGSREALFSKLREYVEEGRV